MANCVRLEATAPPRSESDITTLCLASRQMSGPAAALRLLDMTSDFVGGAAVQSSMMPSLQDMQLVLGALLDLEVYL